MDEIKDFFQIISQLKEITSKNNFEEIVFSMYDKLQNLEKINNDLMKEKEVLIKSIKEKDEELANYKKSSILSSMDKQLNEQKNYISIIEQQLKQYKSNQQSTIITTVQSVQNEIIKEENIVDIEDPKEYETVEYKNKKYYLVGKKVYRINKDKSLGEYYGKYKNGEVIKA